MGALLTAGSCFCTLGCLNMTTFRHPTLPSYYSTDFIIIKHLLLIHKIKIYVPTAVVYSPFPATKSSSSNPFFKPKCSTTSPILYVSYHCSIRRRARKSKYGRLIDTFTQQTSQCRREATRSSRQGAWRRTGRREPNKHEIHFFQSTGYM